MRVAGLAPGAKVALAVSGGGDSIALMHLFKDWGATGATVLIVDHGLRKGSAKEAAEVRRWAKLAGFPAFVLTVKEARPRDTGIEEQARNARYRLLGAWCRKACVESLLLAHTRDDQAETFLLRLARGSGVDGLSSMRGKSPLPIPAFAAVTLYRPLLGIARSELRDYLKVRGIEWLEDPMNDDPRFARVRMRKLLPVLAESGVSVSRIAEAAEHQARAREALEGATEAFLAAHARMGRGVAFLDQAALLNLPPEIALRALSAILTRISGAPYRPRFERLESLFAALRQDGFAARTLAGCRIGKAPKARGEFGPATLEIRAEAPRGKTASQHAPSGVKSQSADLAEKSPHKGRNRVAIWNS